MQPFVLAIEEGTVEPLVDMDNENRFKQHSSEGNFEKRQDEHDEQFLTNREQAQNRALILQIKNQMILSSSSKEKRKGLRNFFSPISGLFRRGGKDEQPQTPATQNSDAYSVVAVCDGDECLQLEITPLTMSAPLPLHYRNIYNLQ